ncbi:exonuclease sbcCD subunit D, partial [Pseudoalteromonas sp. S1610]
DQKVSNSSEPLFEYLSFVEILKRINLLEPSFNNAKDRAGETVPSELKALLTNVIDELAQEQLL